jgi:hypothetical protein
MKTTQNIYKCDNCEKTTHQVYGKVLDNRFCYVCEKCYFTKVI